jgi:chromosome partitioning protein
MTVMAIVNQKGGVGKTTTAVNLAASLAIAEQDTLLIDIDPQGNASSGCGFSGAQLEDANVYHALIGQVDPQAVTRSTTAEYLSVMPAHINLAGAEVELVPVVGRERKLSEMLDQIRDEYAYIILDCPPSLGILTINALTAADSVLIPVQCEYYALEGLSKLLHTVSQIQRHLNPQLQIAGVLQTMYDGRLNIARTVATELTSYFGDKVYKTIVHRNVRLAEAPSHGLPIALFDILSQGAQDYISLAGEIIDRAERTIKGNERCRPWIP